MTVFCTYCSAEKATTEAPLPALDRYRSERIRRIHAAALAAGQGFFILSGEYGLLAPDDAIPCYDHLLLADEVADHAVKVAAQIERRGITRIIFFSLPLAAWMRLIRSLR